MSRIFYGQPNILLTGKLDPRLYMSGSGSINGVLSVIAKLTGLFPSGERIARLILEIRGEELCGCVYAFVLLVFGYRPVPSLIWQNEQMTYCASAKGQVCLSS
jgi:hypothetical protein